MAPGGDSGWRRAPQYQSHPLSPPPSLPFNIVPADPSFTHFNRTHTPRCHERLQASSACSYNRRDISADAHQTGRLSRILCSCMAISSLGTRLGHIQGVGVTAYCNESPIGDCRTNYFRYVLRFDPYVPVRTLTRRYVVGHD